MIIFEAVRTLILFGMGFVIALFITPGVTRVLQKLNLRKRNIRSAEHAPVFHALHQGKS